MQQIPTKFQKLEKILKLGKILKLEKIWKIEKTLKIGKILKIEKTLKKIGIFFKFLNLFFLNRREVENLGK